MSNVETIQEVLQKDISDFRTLAVHFFDDMGEMKKHVTPSDVKRPEGAHFTAPQEDEFNAIQASGEDLEERITTMLKYAEEQCSHKNHFNDIAEKANVHPEDYVIHTTYGPEATTVAEKVIGFNKQWKEFQKKKTADIATGVDKVKKSLRHFKQ